MNNYIDFISKVAKDNNLANDFKKQIKVTDSIQLSAWFNKKGYTITPDECDQLKSNSESDNYQKVGFVY